MSASVKLYAFRDNEAIATAEGTSVIRSQGCGELICRSGKILAGDALFITDNLSFKLQISPGRYPAVVTLLCSDTTKIRVAYVSICLSKNLPSDWKRADPKGFRGDNAIACLADVESATAWKDCLSQEGETEAWKRLFREVDADPQQPCANFCIAPTGEMNLIAWKTDGDCFGACYYGLDDTGNVACITIDTGVMNYLDASIEVSKNQKSRLNCPSYSFL